MMSLVLQLPNPLTLSASFPLWPCSYHSSPRMTVSSFYESQNFFPLPLRHVRSQKKAKRGAGTVCYYKMSPVTLQWVCSVSSAILMLTKSTAIHKSFLVPLFALQAPPSVMSFIQGEYGCWSAFLALLVRLFYYIPGELELPLMTLLLVIVSPSQAMNLRGKQAGGIISLAIAGFLALQHFSRVGSLHRAFGGGSVVATIAIICMTAATCLLFL